MSSIVEFGTRALSLDDDDDEYNMMLTLAKKQAETSLKLASSIDTLSLSNRDLISTNNMLFSANQDLHKKMEELQKAKNALEKRKQTTTKPTTKTKKKTKPCRFFSTEEGCKFGEKCNFLHSTEAISTGTQHVDTPSKVYNNLGLFKE